MRNPLRTRAWHLASRAFLSVAVAGVLFETGDPVEVVREQQRSGDYEGSLALLKELLLERSGDAEIQFLYGRALSGLGQASLAEWSLRQAMKDPEWFLPASQQLAQNTLGTGDYARAVETATAILEANPDHLGALLVRAKAGAHLRHDPEKVLTDVERIVALDPGNIETYEPRILALITLERIDEATQALEEMGEQIEETELGQDRRAWHCTTTVIFAEEREELEAARAQWEICLERYPSDAMVVAGAMTFFDSRGEFERSLEIARHALDEAPASREYRRLVAERLRLRGSSKEGEAILREATRSERASVAAGAWLDLANHQNAEGAHVAAAESAGRSVALARQQGRLTAQLLLEYADILLLARQLERAEAVADEMRVEPHAEVVRARVAQLRGQPGRALEHFDAAFLLWPNNAPARYYAAEAAEAIGDFDRAIEQFRYSIRIAPGATNARVRLAQLLFAQGSLEEALQAVRTKADEHPLDLEGELLSIRLFAELGQTAPVRHMLEAAYAKGPGSGGQAMASATQGVRGRSGAEAATRVLGASKIVRLDDPRQSDVLRLFVRYSLEADQSDAGREAISSALAAHPRAAELHQIEGLRRELSGAPPEAARASYRQALALDPASAHALAGLGRLALRGGDPRAALAYFERAIASDNASPEWKRLAARALLASGPSRDAQERLATFVREQPYDAQIALSLAELDLASGRSDERTLAAARRAARFGGGAAAQDMLRRIHEVRDEPEAAHQAAARVRVLRGSEGGEEGEGS
ncbi:MAG: tetratricopeptide repeat protein [Deltaproteobacteria bacterium]|nr:tetratricopeptide repeat protein [Deltaproteobacteria bacterium]